MSRGAGDGTEPAPSDENTDYSYPRTEKLTFLEATESSVRAGATAFIVSEEAFLAGLSEGYAGALDERRAEAAQIAGAANEVGTLGTFGAYRQLGQLEYLRGDLFLVVRDAHVTEDGQYVLGRDYYVAATELFVPVNWYGEAPQLALVNSARGSSDQCCNPQRVCVPLPETHDIYNVGDPRDLPNEFQVDTSGRPFWEERAALNRPPVNLAVYADGNIASAHRPFEYSCKVPAQPRCASSEPDCNGLPVVDPESWLTDSAQTSVSLPTSFVYVIPESAFREAQKAGNFAESTEARKLDAVILAGAANDPTTLGVLAEYVEGVQELRGDLFIVARRHRINDSTRQLEIEDYYVVGAELAVRTPWYGEPSEFLLSALPSTPRSDCCNPARRCAPLGYAALDYSGDDARALPHEVELNLQGPAFQAERRGNGLYAIDLEVYGGASVQNPERAFEYSCKAPVQPLCEATAPECGGLPVLDPQPPPPPPPPPPPSGCGADGGTYSALMPSVRCEEESILAAAMTILPFPTTALVIREADFLSALDGGSWQVASHDARLAAAQIGGMGNDPRTLGVIADLQHEGAGAASIPFSGELFVVAKGAFSDVQQNRVETNSYYLAAVNMSGTASWLGTSPTHGITAKFDSPSGGCCGAGTGCVPLDDAPGTGCETLMSPQVNYSTSLGAGASGSVVTELFDPEKCAGDMGGFSASLCVGSVMPECTISKPQCVDSGGGFGGESTQSIPGYFCSEQYWTQVIPQDVPKICTQVSGGAIAGSAGSVMANCGGFCEFCGQNYWENERYGLPPGCAAYRPEPDSDICSRRTNADARMEAFLRLKRIEQVNCNYAGQDVGNGSTCCGKNCVCMATGSTTSGGSASVCTECNGFGECRVFSQTGPRHDPLVADEGDEVECATIGGGWCIVVVEGAEVKCTSGTMGQCIAHAKATAAANRSGKPEDDKPAGTADAGTGKPPIPEPIHKDAVAGASPTDSSDSPLASSNNKPDNSLNPAPDRRTAADPILLGDGSFDVALTDLSFRGPVRALTFERHYNSRSTGRSPLGSNWTHNWQVFIDEMRPDTAPEWAHPYCKGGGQGATCLLLHDGVKGKQLFVHDIARDLFVPIAGGTDTMTRTTAGGWVLRTPEGGLRTFNSAGHLEQDRDRFGNGFSLTYEPTPLERLHQRYCVKSPQTADEARPYKSHCQAVGSLLGIAGTPYPDYPPNLPSDVFPAPTIEEIGAGGGEGSISPEDAEKLAYARKFYAYLLGRGIDGAVSYGPLRFRPTSVTDDLHRGLKFTYSEAPVGGLQGPGYLDFSNPNTELLKSVEGPTGALLKFSYNAPGEHPRQLHEAFLTTVVRSDATSLPDGIVSAPSRSSEYSYLWPDTTEVSFSDVLADTGRRHWEVFRRYLHCRYAVAGGEICSGFYDEAFFVFDSVGDPVTLANKASRRYVSDIADNIIEVKNSGSVEAETKYDSDPLSLNFDAAIAQRHGSSTHVPQLPNLEPATTGTWMNPGLPLSTLSYVEAGPLQDPYIGSSIDRTQAFLPAELASRFPLEAPPSHGQLPIATIGSGNNFSTLETERCAEQTWQSDGGTEPCLGACRGNEALEKSKELPGFSYQYQYYTVPNDGYATALKRSRLSCNILALAQLFDPAHNDNISKIITIYPADGGTLPSEVDAGNPYYLPKLIVGGRSRIQADANRICRWAKVVDRDGATQYFGLNFKGQALVEAAYDSTHGRHLVTERLYNADGMVLSVRRPSLGSEAWNANHGSTLFRYEDFDPEGNQGWNAEYPMYWAKRKNLLVTETHASTVSGGAAVELRDFPEDGGSTVSRRGGEYVAYRYEPLFNQLIIQEDGIILDPVNSSDAPSYRVMAQTQHTVDYQELTFAELTPLLEKLRPFGVDWQERSDGSLDEEKIVAFQLPMELGLGDVNGDGFAGLPLGENGAPEGRGLPLYSGLFHFNGEPSVPVSPAHTVHYGWAPHGLPSAIIEDGRSRTTFGYYSMMGVNGISPYGGGAAPSSYEVSSGYRGFLAEVVRDVYPREYLVSDGPPVAPCASLSGPYQWMLGETCSANPKSELESLGVSIDVAADIAASTDPNKGRSRTTLAYSELGTPRKAWLPRGVESFVYDTDGRLAQRTDVVGNTHAWIHDDWGREASYSVSHGPALLHSELYGYDEEGRLLISCVEQEPGACLTAMTVGSDAALLRSFRYSGEGLLVEESDNAGLAVSYKYDSLRRLVWKRDDDVSGRHSPSRFTHFDYTPEGLLSARTARDGQSEALFESYFYDGLKRLWRHVDTRQSVWHFAYSRRNLPVGYREGNEDFPAARTGALEVRQHFDKNRRLVQRVHNGENEEYFTYTSFGQVASRTATGRGTEFFTYDAEGTLVWRRAPSVSSGGLPIPGDMSAAVALPASPHRGSVIVEYATSGATMPPAVLVRSSLELLREDGAVLEHQLSARLGATPPETTYFGRSPLGFLTSVSRSDGTSDVYANNLLGWVTSLFEQVPSSAAETSVFTYSPRGEALSVIDPAGLRTIQMFDGFGALRVRDYFSNGVSTRARESFEYDGLGRVFKSANGTNEETTYFYLDSGRRVRELAGNAAVAERNFDSLGRLTASTYWNPGLSGMPDADRAVVRELAYDSVGRLASESLKVGQAPFREVLFSHSLTAAGTWERVLTHPAVGGGTRSTVVRFDVAGRLASQEVTGRSINYRYLGSVYEGRSQAQEVLASSFHEAKKFDALGRPVSWMYSGISAPGGTPEFAGDGAEYCGSLWQASLCSAPLLELGLKRDAAGRVTRVESQWGAPKIENGLAVSDGRKGAGQQFQYDARARLKSVLEYSFAPVSPGGLGGSTAQYPHDQTLWQYAREDVVGSTVEIRDSARQSVRWSAGLGAGSPRTGYQLKGASLYGAAPLSVAHDDEGNISSFGTKRFEFDARGQLSRVEDGSLLENYFYDDSGRLVARQDETGALEGFLYDGAEMVAADDGAGNVRWEATWGPGLDQLIELRDARGAHSVLTDHRSSVVALWNNTAVRLSNIAEYTPEGRVTAKDVSGAVICAEEASGASCGVDAAFPFGFSSAWRSSRTGLVHMRARWYSPELGEFVSQDPLLYVDSFNPYAYVGLDPINRWDPTGLANQCLAGDCKKQKTPGRPNLERFVQKEFGFEDLKYHRSYECWSISPSMCEELARHEQTRYEQLKASMAGAGPLIGMWRGFRGAKSTAPQATGGKREPAKPPTSPGPEPKGNSPTSNAKAAEVGATVRHGPMNPGPLPEAVANTFRSGSYTANTLGEAATLYRVHGGKAGPIGGYWTRTRPAGPLQSRVDLALRPEWGNTAGQVTTIRVPAGTTIYEGAAASQGGLVGGGSQVFIPRVDPAWVLP